MDWKTLYQQRTMTAQEALDEIQAQLEEADLL